ncbi:MAG: hypothetical protein RSC10_09960 [Longicatena sp.]
MKFEMSKVENQYLIKEENRTVFHVDSEIDGKLLSLYVKNLYEDEILACYQIKKWYNIVKANLATDFTIYEGDNKLGELHSIKDGYQMVYHEVLYRFYCGEHLNKRTLLVFDRDIQIAEIILDEISTLRFSNGALASLFVAMSVLVKDYLPTKAFSQAGFDKKYIGCYVDDKFSN